MKLNLTIIFSILALNFCFGQNSKENNLASIMEKFSDSITAKKYGMVGLHKVNGRTEKYAIGLAYENEKMTTDKVFNIGSLTKMFTSVLVLQEIEKGNLKLSDTLGTFFPRELCKNDNVDLGISIENLLYHRSGLGEVVVDSLVNQAFENPYFEYNHTFLFNKIPKPHFKKGVKYEYCNTNYILLGYILELINDKPYSDLLKEQIFKPCKMKNSYGYFSKSLDNIAHPIFKGQDLTPYMFYQYFKNYSFSAGGISSTIDDLNNFFTNLYTTNILISRNSFKKMTSFKDDYGLGIERIELKKNGKKTIYFGHAGDNISFETRDYYNPKTYEMIILMANQWLDPYIYKVRKELLNN